MTHIGLGQEKEYFVENVGLLLSSGMDIISALESVKEELRSSRMKNIVNTVRDDISNGTPLWKAFEASRLLSESSIALLRAGEKTGRLPATLKIISIQNQKERSFRSKLRSAMLYPGFVLTVTIVAGTSISWFILPRLAGVFRSFHVVLPLPTVILITMGTFLDQHGTTAVPLFFLGLILLYCIAFRFKRTKFIGETLLFSALGVKTLLLEIELARFGYMLRTFLDAGFSITESLDSLAASTTLIRYQKLYSYLRESADQGNSFRKGFSSYRSSRKLIPLPVQQMLVAAEQSGRLSETLRIIEETYDEKAEVTNKNLQVIIEPILLILVWLGVVCLALAIILPIYNLIGSLG